MQLLTHQMGDVNSCAEAMHTTSKKMVKKDKYASLVDLKRTRASPARPRAGQPKTKL